jgi:hypothetical protein
VVLHFTILGLHIDMAKDNSEYHITTPDALGSVRRTVTDAGVPLGVINYDSWGAPETGTVPTLGFTGELQNMGAKRPAEMLCLDK